MIKFCYGGLLMGVKSKLEKVYKKDCQNGYYLFKLNSILSDKKKSKNSIVNAKEIDFNTIQRLIKGDLTRIDLDVVAKLCNELDCGIEDIVQYINKRK